MRTQFDSLNLSSTDFQRRSIFSSTILFCLICSLFPKCLFQKYHQNSEIITLIVTKPSPIFADKNCFFEIITCVIKFYQSNNEILLFRWWSQRKVKLLLQNYSNSFAGNCKIFVIRKSTFTKKIKFFFKIMT